MKYTFLALFLTVLIFQTQAQSPKIDDYNLVWDSPSQDASGQMPLGNGDIAAGVYAIEDGDLYLLLAKNDALTYSGDIFKTGRVKISISPNPFEKGKAFRQELDMKTGSIRIVADGVNIKVWADANRPVYHVEIDAPKKIKVKAEPEFWKRFDAIGMNLPSCLYSILMRQKKSKLKQNPNSGNASMLAILTISMSVKMTVKRI